MMKWNPDDLARIAASDDLHISPFRPDGTTYGTPTWIWSVVVGDELFVRAYDGVSSRWDSAAIEQKAGRISAGGSRYDVAFEPAYPSVNTAVDAAYEAKYAGSPYLPPMVEPRTRAATVRILPT